MKLDKHRFARLIGYICMLSGKDIAPDDIDYIDHMVDINVEPVATQYVSAEAVDELLKHINRDGGFIYAIKAYRCLTGLGLKESKEAVEKYRNVICTKVAN